MSEALFNLLTEWRQLDPATWAESRYGWITETGQPVTLADWQGAILAEYWQRRDDISTLFISCPKKTGKTFLNSLLVCYRWLTLPGVHFALGNDKDQASLLQSAMITEMVKRHPILKRYTKVNKSELIFTPTDSRLFTLPSDYAGSAGHNFLTVSFTELWAFTFEGHIRLYEELTPPPLVNALRIVDSYAGFDGESLLLDQVWKRGESGQRVNAEWPIILSGQQLSYIHQGEEAQRRCWRGTEAQRIAYYAEQAETLRPGTYNRLHLNLWAASEDVFITSEQWDALVTAGYRCPGPDKSVFLHVAADIGVKHDHSAIVSVFRKDGELWLGPWRIWKPESKEVDLQAVEDYLVWLYESYGIGTMSGDPSQFLHIKQRLQATGIPVTEFVQSPSQMTVAGNTLFDVIRQGRLRVYSGADELKQYVLNARAKETERGIRLVKQTQGRKIDAAIALAMAVTDAEQLGTYNTEVEVFNLGAYLAGVRPGDTPYQLPW
jgi:phage terminase large subunit-like protein